MQNKIEFEDDVNEDLVKEVYLFSSSNTPQGIYEVYSNLDDYSALVVYKYFDDTWNLAYSISDKVNDDYQDTCEYYYEKFGNKLKSKGISVLTDDDEINKNFFVPINHQTKNYA